MCQADLQPAAKIAIEWDSDGVVGCIGKLLMDVPPSFQKTSLTTFKAACTAIHDAGLLAELRSPVSKQAATFVLEGLQSAQSPAADRYTAAALSDRIEFAFGSEQALDPSTLVHEDVDYQAEVYKRCKLFLSGKHAKPPTWFAEWQTNV